VRGAFHPAAGEFDSLPTGADRGTVVLLGFTADLQWPMFAHSPEATEGRPHPLDRWSRRVIGALAGTLDARAIFPSDLPVVPFQRLALRCEPVVGDTDRTADSSLMRTLACISRRIGVLEADARSVHSTATAMI
jgi:hypothetical protein